MTQPQLFPDPHGSGGPAGEAARAGATAHGAAAGPVVPGRPAAFFDFDKTLFHGDSGVLFGRSLASWYLEDIRRTPGRLRRAGRYVYAMLAATRILILEAFWRSLYKLRLIKRSTLVARGYRFLKGFPAREMYLRMEAYVHEALQYRIYPEMIERVKLHQAEGQPVVIVTTGLRSLVEHFKRYLGDDVVVIGCEMKETNGIWAGHVEGPLYGEHKRKIVKDFAREYGIDLERSYAYSDHWSDVPFLETVGNPVVVNPKRKLRNLARKRGWGILEPAAPDRRRNAANNE